MTSTEGDANNHSGGVCILKKYYTCAAPEKERVLRCERDGCFKFIHRSCSLRLTEPFRDDALPVKVVCGKRCYNAKSKARSAAVSAATAAAAATNGAIPNERKKRSQWNSDGPTPNVNSLSVLLDWLREPKNYARWKNGGDDTKVETKSGIASQILQLIKDRGIVTDRNSNDVFAKIYLLEKSFADASEWLRESGKGLDRARVATEVQKRCAHYYDLVASMGQDLEAAKNRSNTGANSAKMDSGAPNGSRKRGAATGSAVGADAKKQQLVVSARKLRSKANSDLTNRAISINAKIAARIAAAKKAVAEAKGFKAKAATTTTAATSPAPIAPVLMTHSFLKPVSTNPLIAKKPATTTTDANAHLAALHASFLLATNNAAAPKTPPSKTTTVTPPTTVTPTTPVDASLAAFNKSALQGTSSSASKTPPTNTNGGASSTVTPVSRTPTSMAKDNDADTAGTPVTAALMTLLDATAAATPPTTTMTAATTGTSASASTNPPMGFSTSLLQVNNSMLQATAEKLQAEAKIATVTANTALLRARKTLRDEGIPQEEIDAVLPLQRH